MAGDRLFSGAGRIVASTVPLQIDAFPRPQVVFQYYDGRTGELRYAEAVAGGDARRTK